MWYVIHVSPFWSSQGSSIIGKRADNCFLTDYPVNDMDPTKHFIEDSGVDVYNRGSFGRGCELDKGPPPAGLPPVPGQDLRPTVVTTYRPPNGGAPPTTPSLYGPNYGTPPLQFYPTVAPQSPIPPQYYPVSPTPTPLVPKYYPVSPPSTPLTPKYYPVGPPPTPLTPKYYPVGQPPTLLPPKYYPIIPPSTLAPPPKYYPVTPTVFDTSTRPTGTYVPSLPPTTFFQLPGEYNPSSVRPLNRDPVPGVVFKDLYFPYGQYPYGQFPYGQYPTEVPTIYGTGNKGKINVIVLRYTKVGTLRIFGFSKISHRHSIDKKKLITSFLVIPTGKR